jgi:hypothetical protein
MKKNSLIQVAVLILILLFAGLFILFFNNKDSSTDTELPYDEEQIVSFDDCVAAGYPVQESYPRQCRTPGGKSFVEIPKSQLSEFSSKKGVIIKIDDFSNDQIISSPLRIAGEVPGNWSFEASFPVALSDSSGKILAEGQAQLEGDWMTDAYVPFTATLEFTIPTSNNNGTLILQKDNPSDLPANDDAVEIPIQYE